MILNLPSPALLPFMTCALAALTTGPAGAAAAESRQHTEIRRHAAPEARQGVAVDAEFFYAITNHAIGKYRRSDGAPVAAWECEEGQPLTHLNAGIILDGKLYCAHSNYPDVPGTGSVEIFDPATLRHIGSHSFGHGDGSFTWLDRRDGAWYACFAYYGNRAKEPGRDPSWTQVVKFDDQWRRQAAWIFPAELVEKFHDYSCSGGAFGPDGRLYVTGHDNPELYVLEIPAAGSVLEWVDTISIPAEGQAFAWDPTEPWVLWSLLKRTREVIVGKIDPAPAP